MESHTNDMAFHMKTTLNIDDGVMALVRAEAARSGRTISEIVEAGLCLALRPAPARAGKLPPLPSFEGGAFAVDIADCAALYALLEDR